MPTLKTVLSQVKDSLVSSAESQSLLSLSFHPVSPAVDVAFSWGDFYQNFALGGLQDCNFFKNEIATFVKNPLTGVYESINIKDQVKLNYYNQYKSYAEIYLSKN
ncbi:hypothetical protein [Flavobacterium gilvum]|uniref:Uncharacterized protein n=1 Tax=Flavobacterium gilvum TaxID=1492737 RepID=A0AAC9I857_9FLAO|nr:hypothetical protein [Flavobacterium gilvum]AOW09797.1 hypothetical protein EM308_09925 [Flavobacterium gilvum]